MAGNAMSTAVMGSAVLAALLVSWPLLTPGLGTASSSRSSSFEPQESPSEDSPYWNDSQIELSPVVALSNELLERAWRRRHRCQCEGNTGISTSPIYTCDSCGRTAC